MQQVDDVLPAVLFRPHGYHRGTTGSASPYQLGSGGRSEQGLVRAPGCRLAADAAAGEAAVIVAAAGRHQAKVEGQAEQAGSLVR
jgi:hypothetical protein